MSEPMYSVNLDRVANQPVSEGLHPFVITDIVEGESKEKHNPMWTVRLRCLTEGVDNGKDVTLWLPLTDNMRWKLEKFLDAVGAPTTGQVTYQQFIGRKFKAQVSHQVVDGRTNANVGEMFPLSTSSKSAPPSKVRSATATPVTRTGEAARTKVASKGLPADAVGENDEIPY
jgi:hypothetical protein